MGVVNPSVNAQVVPVAVPPRVNEAVQVMTLSVMLGPDGEVWTSSINFGPGTSLEMRAEALLVGYHVLRQKLPNPEMAPMPEAFTERSLD